MLKHADVIFLQVWKEEGDTGKHVDGSHHIDDYDLLQLLPDVHDSEELPSVLAHRSNHHRIRTL